jgi:hypothetical protein
MTCCLCSPCHLLEMWGSCVCLRVREKTTTRTPILRCASCKRRRAGGRYKCSFAVAASSVSCLLVASLPRRLAPQPTTAQPSLLFCTPSSPEACTTVAQALTRRCWQTLREHALRRAVAAARTSAPGCASVQCGNCLRCRCVVRRRRSAKRQRRGECRTGGERINWCCGGRLRSRAEGGVFAAPARD